MGRLTLFGYHGESTDLSDLSLNDGPDFDLTKQYQYQDDFLTKNASSVSGGASSDSSESFPSRQFALIEFEKPITCQNHALIIGSKLDTDIHANMCRIAFHGQIMQVMTDPAYATSVLPKVKVFKVKVREGQVERVMDEYTVIGKNMFKKETNLATFTNLKVKLSTGQDGVIEGGFGQSGKVKVRIPGKLFCFVLLSFFLIYLCLNYWANKPFSGSYIVENTHYLL